MKRQIIGTLAVASIACLGAASADAHSVKAVTYVAHLHPMNSKVVGSETTGEARFTIKGDKLTISLNVKGAPHGMMHLQHFHGFKDNRQAQCPTKAADANHDGIIDLIETEPMSGTTMVPFQGNPVNMKIATDTYPKASASGAYHYKKTVSLKALQAAFSKAFGNANLDFDKRVVYIHGIPASTKLPTSVASLSTIPGQVTLPIACGTIERVSH